MAARKVGPQAWAVHAASAPSACAVTGAMLRGSGEGTDLLHVARAVRENSTEAGL